MSSNITLNTSDIFFSKIALDFFNLVSEPSKESPIPVTLETLWSGSGMP